MKTLLTKLGPVTAVIGAQWGDEGKGKVIDILSEHYDVIARAAGGANAGHTIVVDGKKHVFHLLPAGSLHEGKTTILGAGMVIHLPTLLEEIALLEESGRKPLSSMIISKSAHVVFEYHKAIDAALEEARSKAKGSGIGTTKRGIGPAYMEKAMREGIRMEKLVEWNEKDLREELGKKQPMIKQMFGVTIDIDVEVKNFMTAKERLQKVIHMDDLPPIFQFTDKKILIEGAQATLLDLDHGTYPYVTSSFTTIAGALQGLGIPPKMLSSVIGVAKAYCTRVGSGDFLTEVQGQTGDRLRERGGEYGATTGRPRRCGWLDLADLKLAAAINGFTCWNITKLDVLDEEDKIPVATDHKNGKAVYEEMPGWKTSTRSITDFSKLPENAQTFIEMIEKNTGVPVSLIGTGQGREEMIAR